MEQQGISNSFLTSSGMGAAISAGSGIMSGLLSLAGQKRQYKYQKKLMAEQQKNNKESFEAQNKREDWLLQHQPELMKRGLQNAGFSAADPNGIGYSLAATPSMDSVGLPASQAVDLSAIGHGFGQSMMMMEQIRNLRADTKKKEEEAQGQEIANWLNETYGAQNFEAAIGKMNADARKSISDALYADQQKLNSIVLTAAQEKDIYDRLDMDWQKLPLSLRLMAAEAAQAETSAKLNKGLLAKAWQDIRESAQRVDNLVKEGKLTDAQVDVAWQTIKESAARTGYTKTMSNQGHLQNKILRFQYDVQNGMGVTWAQAKDVTQVLVPLGMASAILGRSFGLGVSSPVKVSGFGR